MLWAACCLCYFWFLRAGEICVPSALEYNVGAHLSYSDIAVDSLLNLSSIEVNIKASKMDPFTTGAKLFIDRLGNVLCPVAPVLVYLAARGNKPGPFSTLLMANH